ncbi:TonB-dependent receptor [Sphingomonas sp. PP-F2F-A104-K0414]|uniref:TonB-dependent receptor n=1 Tax=Sphingomonas sp. PP-F2F-A104-K0414 TaxID=2135661 RepID=UPI001045B6A3|nr:TonB-dependent receptor [Sphingomonas sp. PP-F2F-A104-K0414]TCP98174.1 TonB-dependent receptor [Sphingomonas sp. PP-F2F-A104-K0414]
MQGIMQRESGNTQSFVRGAALKSGVSLFAVCLAALPYAAMAQSVDAAGDAPASQSTPTPNALQRTAPSDRAAAAQPSAATGSQPSANAQVPSGGADVTKAEQSTATPQQEAATQDVVVTGIRRSLQTAQAIKKNSEVVVDSISAEDIGALPDRSVTEALQRVPGVSISRFAAGADPDHFSTEGSGVVVRGLTYTRSEINGRDSFSANNGRGLSFADVPSELLGGVDVFKSPSADMIEGGIAGTVNLRTRLPFDSTGFTLGGTLENNYGDFVKKSAPTVSVLLSDRWETGIGQFGLLGSFVRSQVRSRADSVQISNWGERPRGTDGAYYQLNQYNAANNLITRTDGSTVAGDGLFYVPRGAAVRSQEFNRTRYGFSAAGQWRSNDGTMNATAQFLRSDSREAWTENSIEVATDNVLSAGDSQPYPGTSFTFDDDNAFTSGLITGPNGYRADQGTDMRTPTNGLQSNNIARGNTGRFITNDASFNFKWQPTTRLGVTVDYQHVWSKVTVTDLTVWGTTYQNADIRLNGNDPAYVNFVPVANTPNNYQNAAHPSYLDPYNSFYRSAMDHIEDSAGNEDAARIDLDYSFPEESWLTSVRAGYRFSDRQNEARSTAYNWGVLSEIWGGGDGSGAGAGAAGGPVWFDRPIDGNPTTRDVGTPGPQQAFLYDNFFRGQANDPSNGGRVFFPGNQLQDYGSAVQQISQIAREWRNFTSTNSGADGWVPLAQRSGVIAGTPFRPGEVNPVTERNNAAYVAVRFGNDLSNGWNVSGNVGVRYTRTERTSSGFFAFPNQSFNCVAPTDGSAISRFCALPDATRAAAAAFQNGALVANDAKLTYDYFLPSFNAKLAVGGGLQFRAAFNKSVAPPEFGLTRSFYNIGLNTSDQTILFNGGPVAIFDVGNPNLKPVRADNYDLTAEWYFSSVGQLTFSAFAKNLYGVQSVGTQRLSFTNNGSTFDAIVTTPLNSTETGKVRGFEVGYQQTYGFLPSVLSGLGLSANFTYVHSTGVSQQQLDPNDPNVAAGIISSVDTSKLPLQGLSKYQFNIGPFYQRNGLELRAAYNWRSRNLLTIRDVITPFSPVYAESYGQLDASIFYAVTPSIRMGFQGVNLTKSVTRTSYVINDDLLTRPRNWFINDSRFTFSIRASFK